MCQLQSRKSNLTSFTLPFQLWVHAQTLEPIRFANWHWLQNGPYDPHHLNLEALDEPFPVKATIRGKEYQSLILKEAEAAAVLDEVKSSDGS